MNEDKRSELNFFKAFKTWSYKYLSESCAIKMICYFNFLSKCNINAIQKIIILYSFLFEYSLYFRF